MVGPLCDGEKRDIGTQLNWEGGMEREKEEEMKNGERERERRIGICEKILLQYHLLTQQGSATSRF